jgi:hypothetical protein
VRGFFIGKKWRLTILISDFQAFVIHMNTEKILGFYGEKYHTVAVHKLLNNCRNTLIHWPYYIYNLKTLFTYY